MIIQMRKQFKSTTYKIFLWFIIIAVGGIFSLPMLFKQTVGGFGWALRVNGTAISTTDFTHTYNEQREYMWQMRAQYGEWIDQIFAQMDPKQIAFDSLVRKELVNQAANQVPLYVGNQAIIDQLRDQRFVTRELGSLLPLALFDGNGNIRLPLLTSYLRQRGISMDSFDAKVKQAVTQKSFFDLLNATVYVPEFELKKQYSAQQSNKKYSYAVLSLENYLKKEKATPLTKDEIAQFYQRSQQMYKIGEKRNGLSWEFSPESYKVAVSETAIQNYYDKNKIKEFVEQPTKIEVRHIALNATKETDADVRAKAEELHKQLVDAPEQFEALARKESDDKKTANQAGRMAPFARGQLDDKEFERAAFSLQEDGALSGVIKTDSGYQIIQRISKIAQSFKPVAAVHNEISKKIAQDRFAKQFTQDIQAIINGAENQADAVAELANKKGVRARTLSNVVLDGSETAKNLFEIKKGEVTFFVTDELKGVIVQATDIIPAYVPTLESIEKTVMDDLYTQKASASIQKELQELKKHAEKNESLAGISGVRVEKTGWIGASETEEVKNLEKQDIPVAGMKKLAKKGAVLAHHQGGNGYLVMLDEIAQFDPQDFAEHKNELKKSLISSKTRLMNEGLVASLYRNATIETNESLSNIPG